MPEKKSRLSAEDWLRAGFRALVETGPHALKAEPLARALGTTKGSFYWHFRDIPDFHARLVAHWASASFASLTQAANAASTPTEQLQKLAEITRPEDEAHGGPDLEPAMRAWARSNPVVAAALAEIDEARMAYTGKVLAALDLTNPDFARLLYGAHIGMSLLPGEPAQNDGALSTLTAALLALQEA